MKRLALLFSLLAILPSVAQGGLKWETTVVHGSAVAGQEKVVAEFPFKNEQGTAAEITSIRTSCGCTTVALAQKTFGPGEKGALFVTFEIGDRTGIQRKVISVEERGAKAATILVFEVELPEPISVSPDKLIWERQEALSPKKVAISPMPEIEIQGIETTNPIFQVQEKKTESGVVILSINSAKDTRPLSALLRIRYAGKKSGMIAIVLRLK